MSAISPQDWQDQEDGRALRELREALPGEAEIVIGPWLDAPVYLEWKYIASGRRNGRRYARGSASGPTIAGAARACRAALRERAP